MTASLARLALDRALEALEAPEAAAPSAANVATPTTQRTASAINPRLDSFRSGTGTLVARNVTAEYDLGIPRIPRNPFVP